jgi:thiol-disulfide isomerase/thioredoxin
MIWLFRHEEEVSTGNPLKFKNGRFIYTVEGVYQPEKMTISGSLFSQSLPLDIWVASGQKIKITGKGSLPPLWEVESSIPYQKEANLYTNNSRAIITELAHISAERDKIETWSSFSHDVIASHKKIDSLNRAKNTFSLRSKQIFADLDIMYKTDISPVWLDKMLNITKSLKHPDFSTKHAGNIRKKVKELYNRISDTDKNTPLGYEITANLFPPPVVKVGNNMVDGDFLDINGNTKHLSDYLGKYLLLDFWNSRCTPCEIALPKMKEISETYREKLTIISIGLNSDSIWKGEMFGRDVPWVNIRDPKGFSGLAVNYSFQRGIANYILISPEGKIIDKWKGFGNGFTEEKVSEKVKFDYCSQTAREE